MSFGMSDLTPEGERYLRELEKLDNLEVAVGFQSGDTYEDGTTIVEVAAYNELGTSNIPARPFMSQSFLNHESELQHACDAVIAQITDGGSAETALETLGVFAKGLVQEEIVEGGFTPNAPSTIRRKKSDTPLVDTSTMRQSVNYVIRGRTGE